MAEMAGPTSADHIAAIERLLVSIASSPSEPATAAFKSALARCGREIAEVGGVKAMRSVLNHVASAGPGQNARRAAILEAWTRIPGWHLGAGADA